MLFVRACESAILRVGWGGLSSGALPDRRIAGHGAGAFSQHLREIPHLEPSNTLIKCQARPPSGARYLGPIFHLEAARRSAALASKRVESSVGRGQSAGSTMNGRDHHVTATFSKIMDDLIKVFERSLCELLNMRGDFRMVVPAHDLHCFQASGHVAQRPLFSTASHDADML